MTALRAVASAVGVARRVVGAVGLDLDQAAADAVEHERAAEQVAGDLEHRALEEGARQELIIVFHRHAQILPERRSGSWHADGGRDSAIEGGIMTSLFDIMMSSRVLTALS